MTHPHGIIYWNELMTTDVDKARAFFADVIGWNYEDMPMQDGGIYTVAKAGDIPAGGMMNLSATDAPKGTPPHWMAYFAVDDVDAAVAKVESSGGQVLKPVFEVPGIGRIAMIADPTGAVLGIMTPAPQEG